MKRTETPRLDRDATGVWRTSAFKRAGWSDQQIRTSVRSGRLVRLRHGWLAQATEADQDVVRAVALGGVLTCVSALAWHRVWVPEGLGLHLRCTEELRPRFRQLPGVHRCTHPLGRVPTDAALDDPSTALAVAMACLDRESRVVVLDSVLNLGLLSRWEVDRALVWCPDGARRSLELTAPSGSGTETMVRMRLRALGVKVRTQVGIPGVGLVDLLVGDRLVLEVDSREHHTSRDAYQADRVRDRTLVSLGFAVVRLTYADVVHHWNQIEPMLLSLIRARRHRRRP